LLHHPILHQVNTLFPSKRKDADNDIYSALSQLYQYDEVLNKNLESGLEVKGLVGAETSKNKNAVKNS
jgi:hypothetical protein